MMEMITKSFSDLAAYYARKVADTKKGEEIAPYPGYADSVEMLNELRVHADRNVFPEKLLAAKAPNELPHEFEYRKGIYRCPTFPYWQRAENAVMRIWNEQNYVMKFNPDIAPYNQEGETAEDYFFYDYPTFGSITNQFRNQVTSTMLKDPNAVICIEPKSWYVAQTELLQPIVSVFLSKAVWGWEYNQYALIKLNETVKLEKGEEGLVFKYWDRRFIARIEQVGEKSKFTFAVTALFQHGFDQLPVSRIGSVPITSSDGAMIYQSYFYPARPALDEAVSDFSTLQVSKFANVFMQRWEYVTACDALGCENGLIWDESREHSHKCSTCKGTGSKARMSPLGVMEIDIKDFTAMEEAKAMHIPPAGYIEVNPDVLTFLSNQVKDNIKAGFEVIGIDVTPQVDGTETATGRFIDREELHSLLVVMSQNLFELLEWAVDLMGRMRYADKWQGVVIKAPDTFEISKPHELTKELNEAHISVKKSIAKEYINRRIGNTDEAILAELAIDLDPLFGIDETIITQRAAAGVIFKWQVVMHMMTRELIQQASEANDAFLGLTLTDQRAAVVALAKAFVTENTPTTVTNILDSLPRG